MNKATGIISGISIHIGNRICVLNSLNTLKLRDEMSALSQFYSIENGSIEDDPIAIRGLIHPLSVIFKYSDNTLPSHAGSQSFDARNLRMYSPPQASPAHSHSTPGIFGCMPLHRLRLACGGEPLSRFRSQGLLSHKSSPMFIRPSNHYKHTDPPSRLW